MKKTLIARAAILCAGVLIVAGTAQAALQDRDLDGDSVVDAFYDTELDITWLRNADVNGPMDWDTAVAWADGFSFAGYDDWRLPTTLQPDPGCEFQDGGYGYGSNCTGSEMGHLWYVELGNTGGWITNTGDFQNLQFYGYWSGTEYVPNPDDAWFLNARDGHQGTYYKSDTSFYAMAVHPGDVPVVPEPQTYALMLAGLTALALARRRAR